MAHRLTFGLAKAEVAERGANVDTERALERVCETGVSAIRETRRGGGTVARLVVVRCVRAHGRGGWW